MNDKVFLKPGSFINKKYYSVFFSSLLGALAIGVNTILDSVLGGLELGETALTAVSIVAPLSFILSFFSSICSPGYGMLYGQHNGEFDKENAYKSAGESVIASLLIGCALALVFYIFKKPFLMYYGCSGELYTMASDYYNWKIISAIIYPLCNSLYYLLATDADTLLLSIGGMGSIVVNMVASTVLCRTHGVSGLGLGTFLAVISSIAVYCLHWLKKSNSIHFKFSFRIKEFLPSIKLSSSISLAYLFVGLTDIIMNKVILVSCGVAMITAYSVINLIYGVFEVYGASFNATEGFVATFSGEKNNAGVKNVMKTAIKSTAIVGIILFVLLMVCAPVIPKLYGIESSEIISASTTAARCMAFAAIPYGIAYLMVSVYPAFGKIFLGIVMTFLNDIFCPLAFSIPLAYAFGFTGVSAGMGFNAYFVLGIFALFVLKKYGRKGFPLYLKDQGEESVSYDLVVSEESIVAIRDNVRQQLDNHGYSIEHIEILMEELYRRIYEKNPGKIVMSECTLLFGKDYVRIIVRDDGVIFNFMDENNKIESLNAYTLNCMLEQVQYKEYILTTSFNRNGFVFRAPQ